LKGGFKGFYRTASACQIPPGYFFSKGGASYLQVWAQHAKKTLLSNYLGLIRLYGLKGKLGILSEIMA